MLKTLRIGWRQLGADPGYSAVILLGLAVAIACCVLVGQVVFNQVLPDPDVPDPADVVNLEFRGNIPKRTDDWFDQAPFVFGTTLREAGAPVSAIARTVQRVETVRSGERSAQLGIVYADPAVVDVFGLRTSAGDLRAALRRPDGIALTPESARRLFPAGDALGRTLSLHGRVLTVVALLSRRPRISTLADTDAMAGFDSPASPVEAEDKTEWYSMMGRVVARVAPGHTAAQVGEAAQALFDDGPGARSVPAEWTANGRKGAFLRATPLTRQYLEGGRTGRSNRMLLLGLAAGAALMLALALANVVNLASVRTLARAREIAVRKALGAGPWRLVAQFAFESALASTAASLAGLLLAWWMAPAIGALLEMRLDDGLFAPGRVVLLLAFALALGALAAIYPARIALGVRCVAALAGRAQDEGTLGRGLRRALTTLQFAVALVIGATACVVAWQNGHVAALAHGIRTEGLLAVNLPDGFSGKSDAANLAFRAALSHEPGVRAMAWSMDVPGRGEVSLTSTFARSATAPAVEMNQERVDPGFFDVYAIDLVAGSPRVPDAATVPLAPLLTHAASDAAPAPERPVVLDVAAARALGFASAQAAVGSLILGGGAYMKIGKDPLRVVGVAAPVRFESARDPVKPHVFLLGRGPQSTLTLRGDRVDLLQQAVARVWPRFFPDDQAHPVTVADALSTPYRLERRVAQMGGAMTVLVLLLAAFGVYALAAYTVRRSAREIVVRKLYGAGAARIAGLLAREFAPLLGVAALVGLPLAGWLAQAWLANFAERSTTAFWALPLALLALAVLTALAALRHALIALRMRPTAALQA